MAVSKLNVDPEPGVKRTDIDEPYSLEELLMHLDAASNQISKRMKEIAWEERRSWENARTRNLR